MLNPDAKKLRYLGIDMHSRTRRRAAVVLTYGIFVIATGCVLAAWKTEAGFQHYWAGFCSMLLLSSCVMGASIFREGGIVKRFKLPVWEMRGAEGGWVMLRDLNDWAKYSHGDMFDALPPAQQEDVLRRYKVGNYYFPAQRSMTPERLDEREIAEMNRASRRTLTLLCTFCFSLAGAYSVPAIHLHNEDIAATFFLLSVFAMTGPKASILWSEPDPRTNADLQLVEQNL
jgi:hypothetical protein